MLKDFNLPQVPEFEAWLELERQSLYKLWCDETLTLAATLEKTEKTGRYRRLAEVLEAVHQADPLDETVFNRYLNGLILSQQAAKGQGGFRGLSQSSQASPRW